MISSSFILKIESLRNRAKMLRQLREMIGLKKEQDILPEQWDVLESQLSTVSNKILQRLRIYGDKFLAERTQIRSRKVVINLLGELEMKLTDAFVFFDTFMDILTQRLSDDIGPLLRGCDVIAEDALRRGSIADLTIAPLVYCDRGFGASTLREGVSVLRNIPNPIPCIAIPYSRLNEKYNLISINHEAGHQALMKLNLVNCMQDLFIQVTKRAGAPSVIQNLFGNWSKEIGPDFWAFCLSGMAQTCSLRDILTLPNQFMFQVLPGQVHPPAYLRFLVSTAWCRQLWGKGAWDVWEEEWTELYSPREMDDTTSEIIQSAQRFIPHVAKACIETKFRRLNGKPIPGLFDFNMLKPELLAGYATVEGIQSALFKKLPIGSQLAVFRIIRESGTVKASVINNNMNQWLKEIQNQ